MEKSWSIKPKVAAMAALGSVVRLGIVLLVLACAGSGSSLSDKIPSHYDSVYLNRTSFPPCFAFGTASAAYQVSYIISTFRDGALKNKLNLV